MQFSFLNKTTKIFKNKYFYTFFLFLLWMLLFDRYNIISQVKLKIILSTLQQQKVYYQNAIYDVTERLENLKTNDVKLERFAREKYFMKKQDEDIFIFYSE